MDQKNIQGMWTFNIYTADAVVPFGNVSAFEKNSDDTIIFYLSSGQIVESPCDPIDYDILVQFQKTAAITRFNLNVTDYVSDIDFMAPQDEKVRILNMLRDMADNVTKGANEIKKLFEHAIDEEKREFHTIKNDSEKMAQWIAKMKAKQN